VRELRAKGKQINRGREAETLKKLLERSFEKVALHERRFELDGASARVVLATS
jgi:hypothetical protein